MVQHHPALRYAGRLRNPLKRRYALDYVTAASFHDERPEAPVGLGCMAAQAVRLTLDELMSTGGYWFTDDVEMESDTA